MSAPNNHIAPQEQTKGYNSCENETFTPVIPPIPPVLSPSDPLSPPNTFPEIVGILGPQHAEFKLYIPSLAVPTFSMEYIYEFATRLLFVSVDWSRSINPHAQVTDPKHIDSLQEQSHSAFKRYVDTKFPTQPERFAKVLLRLPSIRAIDRSIVEELFFVPLIGTVRISDIMENIVAQTQDF
ncbi:hypothetical protein QZH41_007267 [Actinostola sp. cb2023]|nr:hypothetical protein QZH41_007267 [Actinostola sp. cb2023]